MSHTDVGMTDRTLCPSHLGSRCSFSSSDSDFHIYQQRKTSWAVKQKRSERQASCFSRAARWIRGALSRICRVNPPLSDFYTEPVPELLKFSRLPLEGLGLSDIEKEPQVVGQDNTSGTEDYYDICDYANISISSSYASCHIMDPNILGSFIILPQDQLTNLIKHEISLLSVGSETESVGDTDSFVGACVAAVNYTVTNSMPTHSDNTDFQTRKTSKTSFCSLSMTSLSQTTCAENKTLTRSDSLPDMKLNTNFEEFTPDITVDDDDDDDESYRFQCSCPGVYQCSVTGLVFDMKGEGTVVYRTVPWNRRLLVQHHKKPAGPLFDIRCVQQSMCQLHLPHCEIRSTGGCHFLSVAHVTDEGVKFISPHKITETHVVINITGFSAYGNVKDEDSAPDPVRALVLLFYRPPAGPDPESQINVLLLPKNVFLRDVQRTRKKLVGEERYIETSPHCKLLPNQVYALSTQPQDDSVEVQPTEAEFDEDSYDNYFPSFQVDLEKMMKHIKLILGDTKSSVTAWERRVCLSSTGKTKSCGPSAMSLPPNEKLLDIRSNFIDGISEPVLQSLLDELLEKKVISDSERESAEEMQNKRDRARFVIDTVRKKGEAASSEMIEFLCELDSFLCEHLDLI